MSSDTPHISVVIVTHNSLPALKDCLAALLRSQVESVLYEIVVVDNASTDGSADEAERIAPNATVLRLKANQGFASACDAGADAADGEYLLFLNPDVIVDPDALMTLLKVTREYPKAGLVTGRLRFANGEFQATCRQFPTAANMLLSRGSVLFQVLGSRVDKQERYTLSEFTGTTEVPAVAAAMVMIRRELFEQLGGFDRRFFMYMEDTDLSLRVSKQGHVNVFVPEAGGVHLLGEGSAISQFRRRRLQSLAVWKYFLKHHPNGFSVILLPILLTINLCLLAIFPRRREV